MDRKIIMTLRDGTLNKERLELGRGFNSKVRVQWTLRNKEDQIVHKENTKYDLIEQAINSMIKENDF